MSFQNLYIVTGKGGVGKTLTSLALTKSIANSTSQNVYYFSFEQAPYKQLAQDFGVKSIELTHKNSVEKYIAKKLNSKTIAKWIVATPFFNALFDIVPSFGHLVFLGHLIDLVKDNDEIIVVDAPASGHLLSTIHSPKTFKDIFKIGPIANDIDKIHNFLTNPDKTKCAVVSIPTELAVEEGIELQKELESKYDLNTISILNTDLSKTDLVKSDLPEFISNKISYQESMVESYNHNFNFSIPFIVGKTPIDILNKMEPVISSNINDFKISEVEDV